LVGEPESLDPDLAGSDPELFGAGDESDPEAAGLSELVVLSELEALSDAAEAVVVLDGLRLSVL
jgi:hypothetical protein